MRAVNSIIFFLLVFQALANQYTVFVKDGFYGLRDNEGNVAVPPVYDQLGWSDETEKLIDEVIGFKENGYWGLISTKNRVVAEAKYYSIVPFDQKLLKVAIKGRFSNQLFYGLINASGKIEVNTNYFSVGSIDSYLLVSDYAQRQKFGIIDFAEKRLVPSNYKRVRVEGDLFFCRRFSDKLDVYKSSGLPVCQGLDSIRTVDAGIVGYKQGYAGFVNRDGIVQEGFRNKDIQFSNGEMRKVPFPTWEVYSKDELLFDLQADSLGYRGDDFWDAYINGTHHLVSSDSSYQFKDSFLKGVSDNHYLLQNTRSGKWSALTKQHEVVLQDYDSLHLADYAVWGQQDGTWQLHNRYGEKRNRFAYQSVLAGNNGQFIVQLNGHWGIMDPLGTLITPIKYDAIERVQGFYRVGYLGKSGIMDVSGAWKVRAEYHDVSIFKELFVGRKGYSFSYFGLDGLIAKTTLAPVQDFGNSLLIQEEELVGLMNLEGRVVVEPCCQEIHWRDGFFTLKGDSSLEIADGSGNVIFESTLELQAFGGQREDLFLVEKRDKWGFLDAEGRLRIGNRYDSARLFAEGLAPVKFRNKWGFIDKNEVLVIQPYYDDVSYFEDGLSIVSINDRYGLIDRSGNEIVKVKWKEIVKLETGNYRFTDELDQMGIISSAGKILLRPSFDFLIDYGDKILVTKNNLKGVLDYRGNQIFKIGFKEIKISGDYTTLKH